MADSSVRVGSSDMHPQTPSCWHAVSLQRPGSAAEKLAWQPWRLPSLRRSTATATDPVGGLAVPTTPEAAAVEAAGVGETYTMVEATTHAMGEAVVAAVRDIISTIGQIAVGEVGVAVVGTTVARVGH
jgi:hypothetical protein